MHIINKRARKFADWMQLIANSCDMKFSPTGSLRDWSLRHNSATGLEQLACRHPRYAGLLVKWILDAHKQTDMPYYKTKPFTHKAFFLKSIHKYVCFGILFYLYNFVVVYSSYGDHWYEETERKERARAMRIIGRFILRRKKLITT